MKWELVYAHHTDCCNKIYNTIHCLQESGFTTLPASVPGNLELDLMKSGKLSDLYFSTNVLEAQKLEDVHVWYYTKVFIENQNQYLHFEGIDTFADIYINGKFVQSTDNMFLPYDIETDWVIGENEVVVHIKPTMLEARKSTLPVACFANRYNYSSLYVRKAAHMFGWDIMPRIISSGLWKSVSLLEKKSDAIREVYMVTNRIEGSRAFMSCFINFDLSGTLSTEYQVKIEGCCGQSNFIKEDILWHNTTLLRFYVDECKLWWPKNAGKPNLYDVKISLLKGEEVCDTYLFKAGIRTLELERTDVTDNNGCGEFCFKINGKKIFILGTNWVPLDALHANDSSRLPKALELLDDIGCNMVRCWGGNVYESEEFFDYCDSHGIMIWQDFAMGCAIYPDDDRFAESLQKEAVYQIKRLRNHASLVLWAGDNECDVAAFEWTGYSRDPNNNHLTREVLRKAVRLHDYSRPYLPSSPYVSESVYAGEGLMPEMHLWGPRDYFKGPYYKDTFCHFASEIGYHGLPSLKSLQRFLKEPERIFKKERVATDEYLVHASSMELASNAPYAARIPLFYDQVVTLFGKSEKKFDDFIRQSQISQAEAIKYFIEKFRIDKWKRTGIIWWNLLDGWPQISDAIVDYYYTKKLAYHYIKRSQEPVCLMFDEPDGGQICLVGVNDLPVEKKVSYRVMKEQVIVASGEAVLGADSTLKIDFVDIEEDEKKFYLIEWMMDGKRYKNHYYTNIIGIDYRHYMSFLQEYGMDEFEGF